MGLTFGIAGTVCILNRGPAGRAQEAAALPASAARRDLAARDISGWAALSLPLILFHAGFSFGGPLTAGADVAPSWVVFLTGVYGLAAAADSCPG